MMTYRREELGRRMSYIFSCAAFAGAVGGLIGYGLVRIETGDIVGWQWLYIVEGVMTLCLAPVAYFWVPNTLTEAWFLSANQKQLVAKRYEINKRHFDDKESFRWSEVFKALTDWRVYTSGSIQFAADVTLYGISTFMPQIIRSMGFSNVMAQALTVPGVSLSLSCNLIGAVLTISLRVGRRVFHRHGEHLGQDQIPQPIHRVWYDAELDRSVPFPSC